MKERRIALICCLFLSTVTALGQVLSNRELITLMPDEVESVLVLRSEPLTNDKSPFRREMQGFFGIADANADSPDREPHDFTTSSGGNNLDRLIFSGVSKCNPVARALGGWGFATQPAGIGLGEFHHIQIWITRDSLSTLLQAIENSDGVVGEVKKEQVNGVAVYSSELESPATRKLARFYFALPNDRTVVRTESLEQMKSVLGRLKRGAESSSLPERWKEAAKGIELDAPILLLRKMKEPVRIIKYDTATEKPEKFEPGQVEIGSFAITAPSGAALRLRIRCITKSPADAPFYFYGGAFSGGLTPSYWKWKTNSDANGFDAEAVFSAEGKNHHLSLLLITLFGIPIAI